MMRALGLVVLSCLLAVAIASVQVAEDAYAAGGKLAAAAAADMTAPDDGFLTITPSSGVFTIGSAWSPPDPVRCKKGHVVSPYLYTVSYWDDQGRRHNVDFKVCPLCYIENFRNIMVARPTEVVWPANNTPAIQAVPTAKPAARKKP